MKSNPMYLIVFIVLFFGQAGMSQATDPADRSGVISKRDASVQVVTSGEIDSSKVAVGAYVEITYYKGEKRETTRGYIKAVDSETLTIGRGFWKEQIAFERIQTLIVGASDRRIDKYQASIERDLFRKRADTLSERLVNKLGFGTLAGLLSSGVVGAGVVGGAAVLGNCKGDPCGLGLITVASVGAGIGWLVGVPIGVSWADPHDRFASSLAGSLIGGGAATVAWIADNERLLPPLIILGPLVGATFLSELSRKTPEASGFSVGLSPSFNGRLVAQATFRF